MTLVPWGAGVLPCPVVDDCSQQRNAKWVEQKNIKLGDGQSLVI
jgi:hypothetical protein